MSKNHFYTKLFRVGVVVTALAVAVLMVQYWPSKKVTSTAAVSAPGLDLIENKVVQSAVDIDVIDTEQPLSAGLIPEQNTGEEAIVNNEAGHAVVPKLLEEEGMDEVSVAEKRIELPSHSHEGLVSEPIAGGGKAVNLKRRFGSAPVARRDIDGNIVIEHHKQSETWAETQVSEGEE